MGSLQTPALQPMFGYFCLAVEKCNRVETVLVPSVFLHLSLYTEEPFRQEKKNMSDVSQRTAQQIISTLPDR